MEELFKAGQINPRDYDVLVLLYKFAQSKDVEKDSAKKELEAICIRSFEKDAQRSFDLLVKFADKRQNVSWVLFSRSQQYLKYSEKNPLEGYMPRKNEIIKKLTKYNLNKA